MFLLKRVLAIAVGIMLCCVPVLGRAETVTVPAVAAPAAVAPHPLMWVIRDDDSTIYLFGSVHAMRDGIAWFTPQIEKRFNSAGSLWLEIADIDDKPRMMAVARKYMVNPNGHMTDGLSADEVRDLDQRLAKYGMSSQMLQGLHKWAVGLLLVQQQLAGMGLESANGIDVTLLAKARAADMSVQGLETMEEQMSMLSPANAAEDTEALRMTLKEMDENPATLDDLIDGWVNGDAAKLEHYFVDKMKAEDPDGYQRLIVARNRNWVPRIEHMLDGKGTVFIAVGTAHLIGPDGVITLLGQDGVKAERVPTGE